MSTPVKTSRSPSVPTLKKLFAVSGNTCAFPSCSTPVYDVENDLICCEVCHIRAQSAGGPRFDADQDDNARHGYENLILLCGTHHKLVDEGHDQYTVQLLLEMKSKKPVSNDSTLLTEAKLQELAERLQSKEGLTLYESHGNIIATEGAVISVGLSYADAKRIAADVYEANAMKLTEQAATIAAKRASQAAKRYIDRLQQESISPNVLLDPGLQYTIASALRATARRAEPDLSQLLVDLLIDRTKERDKELVRLVLDEAVEIAPKLTADEFDAMSIIFLLKHYRDPQVRGLRELEEMLKTKVHPLVTSASSSDARFRHIQYCGCGNREGTTMSLIRLLAVSYPHVFIVDIPRSRVIQYIGGETPLSERLLQQFFVPNKRENTFSLQPLAHFLATIRFDPQFENQPPIPPGILSGLPNQFAALAEQELRQNLPFLADLEPLRKFWENHAYYFSLTSVGIAIAHANLRRRLVNILDLSTWIH